MPATPPHSFFTKPLSAWNCHNFLKEIVRVIRAFFELLLYAIIPRVADPQLPSDPPGPQSGEVDEETLAQCKDIYEQLEAQRKYLDEKARATFGVIAFLSPLLVAALTYLFSHSSDRAQYQTMALSLWIIAFILLVLGFISTVRALAVQRREVLFLDAVIDPNVPALRPYDRTRHARGLLYCASVNEAYNAHIAQCVKSAHVLTALAVIIASLSAAPGLVALAGQKQEVAKTEIVKPVVVNVDGARSMSDSIQKLRDELRENNATIAQVNALSARLDTIEARINSIPSHKRNSSTKQENRSHAPSHPTKCLSGLQ